MGSTVVALVPVRSIAGSKSRLGEVLDAEERRDLVVNLIERTITAAAQAGRIDRTILVSSDAEARAIGAALGADVHEDAGIGLNAALTTARHVAIAGGAGAIVVLPIDIAEVSAAALDATLVAILGEVAEPAAADPLVGLVTDRHERGTNLLVLAPPDVIDFAFGGDSRTAHAERARRAGARYVELSGPFGLDVDTPDDLLLAPDLGTARRAG